MPMGIPCRWRTTCPVMQRGNIIDAKLVCAAALGRVVETGGRCGRRVGLEVGVKACWARTVANAGRACRAVVDLYVAVIGVVKDCCKEQAQYALEVGRVEVAVEALKVIAFSRLQVWKRDVVRI